MNPAPDAKRTAGSPFWHRLTLAVLGLYLVLAYAYVWAVQPRFGPDEPRHFLYVRRLVEKHALPIRTAEGEADGAHTLHPPLYYLLVSPVYAAARGLGDDGAIRAVKCVSPLLLLGALLLFRRTLRRLFPDRPFEAAAALAVVALMPEYLLEASVMNNDGLAVLVGALWIWLLVSTWDEGPSVRTAVMAGLVMAAFVNTKATGWTLSPLWALALLLRARRVPAPRGQWWRDLAVGYGVLLLLGTWWYLRNVQLYGQMVPFDFGANGELRPFDLRTRQPLEPLEVYTTGYVIPYGWRSTVGLFQSFWTQIDWVPEEMRDGVFGALLAVVLAAAAGGAVRAVPALRALRDKARRPEMSGNVLHPLWILATAIFLNWLHTWFIATFLHLGFYQGGRYLMPSVFGAGALLAAGWGGLVPPRVRPAVVLGLVAALGAFNALCLHELITVLNPRYVG